MYQLQTLQQLQTPKLNDGTVDLVPFNGMEDFDYLFKLADDYRFADVGRQEVEALLYKHGLHFWSVCHKETGIKGGVIYISDLPQIGYSLDAYKDDATAKAINNRGDFAYKAAKMVLKFFFEHYEEVIFTTHTFKNRAATILNRRLGFDKLNEYDTRFGKFVIMANKGE